MRESILCHSVAATQELGVRLAGELAPGDTVALNGDLGAGKTCLLLRYVNNTFSSTFITTIGVDFKRKTVGELQLQLWDTAGQERFRTLTHSFYKQGHGIIVAFAVNEP